MKISCFGLVVIVLPGIKYEIRYRFSISSLRANKLGLREGGC